MKALVLCAGYGTRIGDLTRGTPKPLLPVGGEPLLGWTLRYLAHYGFTEVALNLHYKPEMIRDYCGEGSRFGVCIHYSDEPSSWERRGRSSGWRDFLAMRITFWSCTGTYSSIRT